MSFTSRLIHGIRTGFEAIRSAPDMALAEKQLQEAIDLGTVPTLEEIKETRIKKPTSRLDLRKRSDSMFFLHSFGYIQDLASSSKNVPEYSYPGRDEYLGKLWRAEPILAGAVYSMSAKMTALSWKITGKREEALEYAKLLARAIHGFSGHDWGGFISSTASDFYTTDNGVFWELARKGNPLYGKLIDIGHVDSLTCNLTGSYRKPVYYQSDWTGQHFYFKPGEYIHFASLPSAREEHMGIGFCAVSRALKAAQLLLGLHNYDSEKLANLPPEGIIAITGLTKDEFQNAITLWKAKREENNSLTFPQVLWLIGSQPNTKVSIDFAAFSEIPESFDRNDVVTQYINTLALDFGVDAREFWPISTSSLGTAAESEIQHMKAKGKGPGEFISVVERKLNGELPEDADFEFDTQDIEEDKMAADVAKAWVDAYLPLTSMGNPAPAAPAASGQDGKPTVSKPSPTVKNEFILSNEDFLRLLADKGVLPDHMVHDDRIAIEDSDVHVKHNKSSEKYSTFVWKGGLLKEQRLPPIVINSPIEHDIPFADTEEKGGAGSGHFEYAGIPGHHGGSLPSGSSAVQALSKGTYDQHTPQKFADALQDNLAKKYSTFVTQYTAKEYREMGASCYISASGQSGYAIKPDGDIISVFSKSGSGEGKGALMAAISQGGTKLDCFDGFLPSFYNQFGFQEYDRWTWDAQYAPVGWDTGKFNSPDIVLMSLGAPAIESKSKKDKMKNLEKAQREFVDDVFGGELTPEEQEHVKKIVEQTKVTKGGQGSGHFGHSGRPGKVGGSASGQRILPGGAFGNILIPPGTPKVQGVLPGNDFEDIAPYTPGVPSKLTSKFRTLEIQHLDFETDSIPQFMFQEIYNEWQGYRSEIASSGLEFIDDGNYKGVLAFEEGELVGVAAYEYYEGYLYVGRLATKRSGFGRALMLHIGKQAVADDVKGIQLSAAQSAVGFYEKMGMTMIDLDYNTFEWTLDEIKEDIRMASKSLEDLEPEDGVFVATSARKLKEQKEEPKRGIRGAPIKEHEVIRGAQITKAAIKEELKLWRKNKKLETYSVPEDEQKKYIQEQIKQ